MGLGRIRNTRVFGDPPRVFSEVQMNLLAISAQLYRDQSHYWRNISISLKTLSAGVAREREVLLYSIAVAAERNELRLAHPSLQQRCPCRTLRIFHDQPQPEMLEVPVCSPRAEGNVLRKRCLTNQRNSCSSLSRPSLPPTSGQVATASTGSPSGQECPVDRIEIC
jgi:hypothetical protein